MPQYLLKRHLRHLKSISVNNISLIDESKKIGSRVGFIPCFIVLEDPRSRKPFYVSELETGSLSSLHFTELVIPKEFELCTLFEIKIAAKIPSFLLRHDEDELWCFVAMHTVNLDELTYIGNQRDDHITMEQNLPMIEMIDGWYALPNKNIRYTGLQISPVVNMNNKNRKRMCPFNSLVKLSKLTQYTGDMVEEKQISTNKIERLIKSTHNIGTGILDTYQENIKMIESRCEIKRQKLKRLKDQLSELDDGNELNDVDSNIETYRDEYANIYSKLSNAKEAIEKLQKKKLIQLINVFKNTFLFDKDVGLISFEFDDDEIEVEGFCKNLERVSIEQIYDRYNEYPKSVKIINAMLGFYSLFIVIYSYRIIQRKLPFDIVFQGSETIVGRKYRLSFPESRSTKSKEEFHIALRAFNENIMQFTQYLGHITQSFTI